jgi:hypothetical protein
MRIGGRATADIVVLDSLYLYGYPLNVSYSDGVRSCSNTDTEGCIIIYMIHDSCSHALSNP